SSATRARGNSRSFPASCADRRTTRSARRSSECSRNGKSSTPAAPSPSSPRCATFHPSTWPTPGASISRVSMPNDEKPIIRPVDEAYWVIEGRLLAGGYPGGKRPQDVERRLGALLDAGFDAFIDLTEGGELPPYQLYLPGHVR